MQLPSAERRALVPGALMIAGSSCLLGGRFVDSVLAELTLLASGFVLTVAALIVAWTTRPVTGGARARVDHEFLTAEIAVPSHSPTGEDLTSLVPLRYDRRGVPMVAAFTTPSAAEGLAGTALSVVSMTGADLVRRTPAGNGIVVDVGDPRWFEFLPDAVARARTRLDRRRRRAERRARRRRERRVSASRGADA